MLFGKWTGGGGWRERDRFSFRLLGWFAEAGRHKSFFFHPGNRFAPAFFWKALFAIVPAFQNFVEDVIFRCLFAPQNQVVPRGIGRAKNLAPLRIPFPHQFDEFFDER